MKSISAPLDVGTEIVSAFVPPSGDTAVSAVGTVIPDPVQRSIADDRGTRFVRAPSLRYPFASNRASPDAAAVTSPVAGWMYVAIVARVKVPLVSAPAPNAAVLSRNSAQNVNGFIRSGLIVGGRRKSLRDSSR